MKGFKKFLTLIIAAMMCIMMAIPAMAATQEMAATSADADGASITINNPAKGETYKVFKLFDATLGSNGEIAYQCEGDIPDAVADFFSKNEQNVVIPAESILVKDENGKVTGSKMTDELKAALEAWAESATSVASAVSDGSEELKFTGLPYGYYVVTTTNKNGETGKSAITVTSADPNASVYDKNVNTPTAEKVVGAESYNIGDTITYTATFDTTNYIGEGANSKQVIDYEIIDTLPEYLSDVNVTSITVDGTAIETIQFTDKKIKIDWADKVSENPDKYTSKYAQGAKIVITYTAKLTSTVNVNIANKNTITIKPYVDDNGRKPWNDEWEDSAEIRTYAAAIHKVNENGEDLAGAQFTIKGLVVEEVSAGVYKVVSYNAADDAAESAVMDTDDDGYLYIIGLASTTSLKVTEYKAPDGYNKIDDIDEKLKPQLLTEELYEASGKRFYDEDGNLVKEEAQSSTTKTVEKNLNSLNANALKIVNRTGVELPSTGGIGTTIFYIIGGLLIVAAVVFFVVRRKADAE